MEKDAVRKIAHLARLNMTEEELDIQHEQLNGIVEMMSALDDIDVTGVEPLCHVMDIHNVYREDVIEPSMPVADVLKNAPVEEDAMFRVPKIV